MEKNWVPNFSAPGTPSGGTFLSIPIAFVKAKYFLNLNIVLQMSEWSQMTELDNLSKNGVTQNLATLHRLACTGSYSSIYCRKRCRSRQYIEL